MNLRGRSAPATDPAPQYCTREEQARLTGPRDVVLLVATTRLAALPLAIRKGHHIGMSRLGVIDKRAPGDPRCCTQGTRRQASDCFRLGVHLGLASASARTRSSAPANAGDSFPRGAVVCARPRWRLFAAVNSPWLRFLVG
jgi:hypothetical protein